MSGLRRRRRCAWKRITLSIVSERQVDENNALDSELVAIACTRATGEAVAAVVTQLSNMDPEHTLASNPTLHATLSLSPNPKPRSPIWQS